MTCKTFASTCDQRDVLPIRRFLRRNVEYACAGCREAMTRIGASFDIVERREVEVPVEVERRAFTPAWLVNLRAKDLTAA